MLTPCVAHEGHCYMFGILCLLLLPFHGIILVSKPMRLNSNAFLFVFRVISIAEVG